MNNGLVQMGGKGKAASPLKVGLKAELPGSEHVPALSADAEVEGAWEQFTHTLPSKDTFHEYFPYGQQTPVLIQRLSIHR